MVWEPLNFVAVKTQFILAEFIIVQYVETFVLLEVSELLATTLLTELLRILLEKKTTQNFYQKLRLYP